MAAPIYGRLEFLRSFCRKTSMSIKFLVLGGGGSIFFGFGGGSADFIFRGAGIFLTYLLVWRSFLRAIPADDHTTSFRDPIACCRRDPVACCEIGVKLSPKLGVGLLCGGKRVWVLFFRMCQLHQKFPSWLLGDLGLL